MVDWGFPGGSDGKASACKAGYPGSIPGSGRSPGEGNGNPLQHSCWKIAWTEEPGRLQSMGSQRVGHDQVGHDFTFLSFPLKVGYALPSFSQHTYLDYSSLTNVMQTL